MSRLLATSLVLAVIAGGCYDDTQTHFQSFNQSIAPKPIVSVVPIIDSTNCNYDWDLSEELTSSLSYRLMKDNRFFLVENEKPIKMRNPFDTDISWIKRTFADDEFVVFLELIEHNEVLRKDRTRQADLAGCSADLNMSVRVRVFDVRGQTPIPILQEIIQESHFIPQQFTTANFHQVSWGDESFNISPLGLAHIDFTKKIASRLEKYILLAAE